jgi:hypothetical protein
MQRYGIARQLLLASKLAKVYQAVQGLPPKAGKLYSNFFIVKAAWLGRSPQRQTTQPKIKFIQQP